MRGGNYKEHSLWNKASYPDISAHSEIQRSPFPLSFCCLLPPVVGKEAFPKMNSSPESTKHEMRELRKGKRKDQ